MGRYALRTGFAKMTDLAKRLDPDSPSFPTEGRALLAEMDRTLKQVVEDRLTAIDPKLAKVVKRTQAAVDKEFQELYVEKKSWRIVCGPAGSR